jgi:tRNA G18 (ribose-2'-O)-methylase SpoU
VFKGPVREVTSASNPLFKRALDVLHGRGIRKHGQALMAGQRIVAEVIQRFPERIQYWLTSARGEPPVESLNRPAGQEPVAWLKLSDGLFAQVDLFGTRSPLVLVDVPPMATWSDDEPWPEGCTLFVPFQDPENVGAVLRTAAAFGVARVVLTREAAHPFHPKSARAAGPALFQVPLLAGPALGDLTSESAPLIGLDKSGAALDSSPWPTTFGLVAGLEGPGLPEHLRAGLARSIPMVEGVESLNAATATAIALYAWRRSFSTSDSEG